MSNAKELKKIDKIFSDSILMQTIDSISINASASAEGNENFNKLLANNRAKAIKEYLIIKYHHSKKNKFYFLHSKVGKWLQFKPLVLQYPSFTFQKELIAVLESNLSEYQKELELRKMHNGVVWSFLKEKILPYQRFGSYMIMHINERNHLPKVEYPNIEEAIKEINLKQQINEIDVDSIFGIINNPLSGNRQSIIAIKTNLLYDLMTAVNLGIEIPIGQRWSIDGGYIGPWWSKHKSNLTYQLQAVNVGLNYWLGNKDFKDKLTGWHIGASVEVGKYDLQLFSNKGEQGSFYNVMLKLGYSYKLTKSLNLKYGIGLGILQDDYKEYDKAYDTKFGDIKVFRYPWETKRRTWIGPNNLDISLVWLLKYSTNKRWRD